MFSKQPLPHLRNSASPDAIQLAHIDSELCWCDPILEFDEAGQQILTHNEVTWN
jgi:hypothetical protein